MTSSSTFVIPSSSSSFWQSSATTVPPHNSSPDQNQHCDIGPPGYAGDLANSYNAIWEHHHHHHHHHHSNNSNSPVAVPPYRTEFFPGFACSTELWHSPAHTPARPLNNGMQINRDTYRSTGATSQQRPSGSKHSSASSSQKKTRRRVATFAQRRAANIRERRRMFNLNEAFDKLRRKVPTFAYEKRLSRIETLRLAITYISFMDEILNGNPVTGDGVPASSLYQMQNQREYVPYVIL